MLSLPVLMLLRQLLRAARRHAALNSPLCSHLAPAPAYSHPVIVSPCPSIRSIVLFFQRLSLRLLTLGILNALPRII